MAAVGTASGTYNFAPAVGELVIAAFRRIGVHRAEIVTEHFADAKMELNLLQVSWADLGPLLWTVTVNTITFVAGQAVYSIPSNVVMITDMYVQVPNGDGTTSDRIITPLSRTEYASMPDKSQQGDVTSFWFNRQIGAQTVTLWPVPYGTITASYFCFTQIQDALPGNAGQPQVPYLALDAYVAGLAHRLSVIYPPKARPDGSRIDYEGAATKAMNVMFSQLAENVPFYVQPVTESYWR